MAGEDTDGRIYPLLIETFALRIISFPDGVIVISPLLDIEKSVPSGTLISSKTVFFEVQGEAGTIHRLWKTIQNLLDYASGVATYTYQLLSTARLVNPDIIIATTRKTIPFTKKIAIKAVESGGGVAHRLGLSESILIFEYHRVFFPTDELFRQAFLKVKKDFR